MTRPALRVVRATDSPPPLERVRTPIVPRLQVTPRVRRRDSVAFGCAVVASLFVGMVLVCLAMGWLK